MLQVILLIALMCASIALHETGHWVTGKALHLDPRIEWRLLGGRTVYASPHPAWALAVSTAAGPLAQTIAVVGCTGAVTGDLGVAASAGALTAARGLYPAPESDGDYLTRNSRAWRLTGRTAYPIACAQAVVICVLRCPVVLPSLVLFLDVAIGASRRWVLGKVRTIQYLRRGAFL